MPRRDNRSQASNGEIMVTKLRQDYVPGNEIICGIRGQLTGI